MNMFEEYLQQKRLLINEALNHYLPSGERKPKSLHQAMRYAVFPGGKRLRPILVLIAAEICGGNAKKTMPLACAIELIHSYSLVHDDLPAMDNSDRRRGRMSCHKRFDEATAILTGDALLTLAFEILAKIKNHQVIAEVSKAIGSEGMVGGQIVDLHYQVKKIVNKRALNYIRERKTGALITTSLKTGAMLTKASAEKIRYFVEFGKSFGIAFQIYDDLKDGELKEEKKIALAQLKTLKKRMEKEVSFLGKKGGKLKDLTNYIF